MKDAFERVKISVMLPKLIQDRAMVVKVLTGTPYEPAIKLVDDFMRRRDIIVREKRPPLMDHGMIKIIDYFQRHCQIQALFPGLTKNTSEREQKLLTAFAKLIDVAKIHLDRDAYEHIQNERTLHKVLKDKQKLWLDIQKLQKLIEEHREEEKAHLHAKEVSALKTMEDIKQKKLRNDMKIEREM